MCLLFFFYYALFVLWTCTFVGFHSMVYYSFCSTFDRVFFFCHPFNSLTAFFSNVFFGSVVSVQVFLLLILACDPFDWFTLGTVAVVVPMIGSCFIVQWNLTYSSPTNSSPSVFRHPLKLFFLFNKLVTHTLLL